MDFIAELKAWETVPNADFTLKCTDGDIKVHQFPLWCMSDAVKSITGCMPDVKEMPVRHKKEDVEDALCYIYGPFAAQMGIPFEEVKVASIPWEIHAIFVDLDCSIRLKYHLFDVSDLIPWGYTLKSVMQMDDKQSRALGLMAPNGFYYRHIDGTNHDRDYRMVIDMTKVIEVIGTVGQNCNSVPICTHIIEDCFCALMTYFTSGSGTNKGHSEVIEFFKDVRMIYKGVDAMLKIRTNDEAITTTVWSLDKLIPKYEENAELLAEFKVNTFDKFKQILVCERLCNKDSTSNYVRVFGKINRNDAAISDFRLKRISHWSRGYRQITTTEGKLAIFCHLPYNPDPASEYNFNFEIDEELKGIILSNIPYYKFHVANFNLAAFEE